MPRSGLHGGFSGRKQPGGIGAGPLDQLSGVVCSDCQPSNPVLARKSKPMFDWLEMGDVRPSSGLTWDFVDRLTDATSMKLVIKGIVTREDAELCVEHRVDGIVVSNHGGQAEASGRSTIECLAEIVAAVDGRIPVLIGSGFRRATELLNRKLCQLWKLEISIRIRNTPPHDTGRLI